MNLESFSSPIILSLCISAYPQTCSGSKYSFELFSGERCIFHSADFFVGVIVAPDIFYRRLTHGGERITFGQVPDESEWAGNAFCNRGIHGGDGNEGRQK